MRNILFIIFFIPSICNGFGYPDSIVDPAHINNYTPSTRGVNDIRFIVIHTTEDEYVGCNVSRNHFKNGASPHVSAHYVICRNGDIYRMVGDQNIAHHALGYNTPSIGIEVERCAKGFIFNKDRGPALCTDAADITQTQYNSTKNLVEWLLDSYSIPELFINEDAPPASSTSGIMGHFQVPGTSKEDPREWDWNYFKSLFNGQPGPPSVSTSPATNITDSSAILNGIIVDDGGSPILERRFDWGNNGIFDDFTAQVQVSGNNFSYQLTGLPSNTTYGFRAWARNSTGWAPTGNIVQFTTGQVSSGDTYEPDNSSSQATTINHGSTQNNHSIVPANDIDWVKFTLDQESDVVLETSGLSGDDTRMWLYDSSLSQISYDDDGGVSNFSKITSLLSSGTYYVKVDEYGNNNEISQYSIWLDVTPASSPTYPDLIVQSPSVSDTTLTPGQSFTASATVRNQGTGASSSTTLRYYRSINSTISTSDTLLSTDPVSSLSPGSTSLESDPQTAPSSTGTYWIGACVDSVSGESDTANNCSSGVQVTVSTISHTLTVGKTGDGTITSSPSGINCGSNCSQSYTQGTSVTLSANPASGWTFSGWNGVCVGVGSCVVDMTSNQSVSATFTQSATVDQYEPDDTFSQATTINHNSTQYNHSIVPANDIDLLKFTLTQESDVVLETSGSINDDTRMWLYDSSLSQISYDDDGGTELFSKITLRLSSGTYYVLIDEYDNDDEISQYNISLDVTPNISTLLPAIMLLLGSN